MFAGFAAIYPHAREIKGGAEMKFDVFLRRKGGKVERAEIPRDAFIVVILSDIPSVRNADEFNSRWHGFIPGLGLADGLGVGAKEPGAVEVRFFGGRGKRGKYESGNKKKRAEQERS